MIVAVVTAGTRRCAKLLYHCHQQTKAQLFYWPDAIPVTNHVKALGGKVPPSIPQTCSLLAPSSRVGLSSLSLTTRCFWLPWEDPVVEGDKS